METEKKRKEFRILSLDGGGVRAIIQSTILARLLQRFPNLLNEIDLIAGKTRKLIYSQKEPVLAPLSLAQLLLVLLPSKPLNYGKEPLERSSLGVLFIA